LLVGPVFTREVVTAPRRGRFYVARAAYIGGLLLLIGTAWQVLAGTQDVRNIGDMARFGSIVFQILAPLQLALALFFSALLAASAVALEKDRKTLVLLLLTRLTNAELVLGKLLASMLNVLMLLAAAIPLFMLVALFGGVAFGQIARVTAVTLATALAAGSLGSTLALWREKTFQALALTVLLIVIWLGGGEAVRQGVFGQAWAGVPTREWAAAFSPLHATLEATRAENLAEGDWAGLGSPVYAFLGVAGVVIVVLNALAIGLVRVWNPSREATAKVEEEVAGDSIWGAEYDLERELAVEGSGGAALPAGSNQGRAAQAAYGADEGAGTATAVEAAAGLAQLPPARKSVADLASAAIRRRELVREREQSGAVVPRRRTRRVWDNPVIWREMRTWCYGRKIVAIKLGYLALVAAAFAALYVMAHGERGVTLAGGGVALIPLFVVSLILVNAQAVTSLTAERDVKALDLLLVTDLTPSEFIFGKLGGALFNAKEMIAAPLLLCGYLWWLGEINTELLVYLLIGLATMNAFVTVLGLHAGMTYGNSRQAIAVSLGTVFFLFIGVATCMRIMVAFPGEFHLQIVPFAALAFGGGIGLYVALGVRNPSPAIFLASFACPFATFYAITSFMLEKPLAVLLATVLTYGFTTAAMLVPAVAEFDVATGRTSGAEE